VQVFILVNVPRFQHNMRAVNTYANVNPAKSPPISTKMTARAVVKQSIIHCASAFGTKFGLLEAKLLLKQLSAERTT
jgi:hypothetical protein